MLSQIKKKLKYFENKEKAKVLQKYFKTGKGEYGEGDVFLGVSVPDQRKIVNSYKFSIHDLDVMQELLKSNIHEHRFTALLSLIKMFREADNIGQKKIYNFYLKNLKYINNWDLVDISSHEIIGKYVYENPSELKTVYRLENSKKLFERRIAILCTYYFIKKNNFLETLKISERLLKDKEDLIHKAVGWMLREIGKRNIEIEKSFLNKHYKQMPRTMLRYAIEKFDEEERKKYLKGLI